MSILNLTLSIKESQKKMERELLGEIIKGLNKQFIPLAKLIQADLAIEVPKIFVDRDVTGIYNRLVNGPLNLDFGFTEGDEKSRINDILTQIGKSVQVEYKPMRRSGAGISKSSGFTVKILRTDFFDILGLSAANVINISKNPKAANVLPWLEWLLLEGDSVIISDHIISFEEGGRSGGAVMISDKGGVWKVPEGSSGTRSDNWLTREVLDAGNFLAGLSLGVVDKHIRTVIG